MKSLSQLQLRLNLLRIQLKINPNSAEKGDLVHKLAAKRLIKDCENNRSMFHDSDGKLLTKYSQTNVDKEIIRISSTYGVISKLTAFVAVETRDDATVGEMKLRKITMDKSAPSPSKKLRSSSAIDPNLYSRQLLVTGKKDGLSNDKRKKKKSSGGNRDDRERSISGVSRGGGRGGGRSGGRGGGVTQGFEMLKRQRQSEDKKESMVMEGKKSQLTFMDVEAEDEDEDENDEKGLSEDNDNFSLPSSSSSSKMEIDTEAPKQRNSSVAPSESMRSIIMSQKASGCWVVGPLGQLAADVIRKSTANVGIPVTPDIETLWMTALVIVYLVTKFEDQIVNWDMVVDKARKWMKKEEKRLGITNIDWESLASSFISKNSV